MSLLKQVINEGITHIEDLPLQAFITAVETLKEKTVTEKLDGSNLWFGVDDKGVFTSREGKSRTASRFYSVNDYPTVAAYNGFRGAHEALVRHEDVIKKHLQVGDMVETEVLFGRQPNTVTYGNDDKNFIVVLRGIETDQKKVDALSKELNGKHSSVKSTVITSDDGENLKKEPIDQHWEFTQVKPLDTKAVDLSPALAKLEELKKYMAAPNAKVSGKSNQEVAEISLNKVPKEQRPAVKEEREAQLDYILKNFKQPIKKFLLDVLVRKVKPFLQSKDIQPDEDIGVEGVVASDKNGNMVKIVDKDMFTSINTFNNFVRNNIAGLVRTDDQDAPIEMRGGAFGQAKIRIANLLGMKELALSSNSRKILTKFKGATPEETAKSLADSIQLSSFESARTKTTAILDNALEDIDAILKKFKDNMGSYKLKLETGKEIGISPEVMKRTLTAFAETKRDVNQVNAAVSKSRDLPEMIMSLYGRTIQGLFSGDQEVKESKFSMLKTFSIKEEGDGGGGDGGAAAPAPAEATMAGNFAPVEKRLANGRMISRRQRKFIKKKKFAQVKEGSLLKMFEFMTPVSAKNAFATDVDDTVSAKNDVEFKSLRNQMTANQDATTQDVVNYLDKAHELNDEVDTVTFGMEMDDGSVVKIYVNSTEADAFERALANKLGEEDDVEAVIDELSNDFDIVDVEWPDGASRQSDDAIVAVDNDGDITGDGEITSELDADGEEQVSPIIDLSPDEPEEPTDSLMKQVVDKSEEPDEFDLSTLDDEDQPTDDVDGADDAPPADDDTPPADDAPTDDAPPAGDEGSEEEPAGGDLSDLETEEEPASGDEGEEPLEDDTLPEDGDTPPDEGDDTLPEDDDTPPEDGGGSKKKKKKKDDSSPEDDTNNSTETKESNMSFGQRFKEKLLAEKAEPKKAAKKGDEVEASPEDQHQFPEQLRKLMVEFSTPGAKMMIGLMYSLGVPIDAMVMKKGELKKSVDGAGDQYMKDSQLRMRIKRAIESLQAAKASDVTEALADELTSQYQKLILAILVKIGLTDSIEKLARSALRTGIKAVAALAQTDTKVRTNLKVLADLFGIDTATGNVNEAAAPTSTVKRLVNKYILDVTNDGDTSGPEAKKTEAKIKALENGAAILRIAKQAASKFAEFTHMGDAISKEDKVKLDAIVNKAVKLAESVEEISEARNYLGNKEYNTWAGWKAAVKKAAAGADLGAVWFDGDQDISQALVGANPYKKGESFSIGEWDGEKGDVNEPSDLQDTKKRMGKLDEAEEAPESGINKYISDVKTLAVALGIPEANVKYREIQVDTAIRKGRTGLKNVSTIQLQIARLLKLLGQ